ncbi:MAG: hypothetical protein Q9167_005093 [Letrouitia subvulpina]
MPLPATALTIRGGCNCRAVRYEISVPPISNRPIHPYSDGSVHIPFTVICHCNDCRCASGGLVLAGICSATHMVRISLLPRTSPMPPLQTTRVELPNDDAERAWVPAQDVFRPSSTLDVPADSFLRAYKPSEDVTRTFCGRCGTNVTYSRHPMPDDWPEMLDILMGTVDKECLEKEELKPDRHVWWGKGIGWVKSLFDEDGREIPKHPLARLTDRV